MTLFAHRSIPPAPTDLVWIQTGFIGDIVLTTAAIELASKKFPGIKQHVITTGIGEQVMKACEHVASITVFQKRSGSAIGNWLRVAKAVRKNIAQPQSAVTMQVHRSFRSSMLAWFMRLPTITYRETIGSWLADARIDRVSVLHEAARIALPLQVLGVDRHEIVTARPRLKVVEDKKPTSDVMQSLQNFSGKKIGIAAGSVWGTKRWPVKSFAELIDGLLADGRNAVVLLGSKDEAAITASIVGMVGRRERLWNLAGTTTIPELNNVIAGLDLLVSNDSSPVHFASGHNVPTVAIFGATIPQMGFGPLADRRRVAGIDISCRPCSDHGPQKCPLGHFRCMLALSPASLLSHCQDLLRK